MTNEEKKAGLLRKKIAGIGPMLPGSISKQWNVCGTPGCKCKDRQNPVKHGPYCQLSFTVGGKSSTMFIKPACLREARGRIANYRRFKKLCVDLVLADVAAARAGGFTGRGK